MKMHHKSKYTLFLTICIILVFIFNTTAAIGASTSKLSVALVQSSKTSSGAIIPAATTSSSVTAQIVPILALGSKGYNVTLLQTKLKKIGYFSASTTGNFLTVTKDSVIKFQKNSKLSATGIVGILTWNALNKRIGASSYSRGQAVVSSKYSVFNRVLKYGSKGNDVSILQDKLIGLGLLSGKKDGIYGTLTVKSVKNFQTYKKLTVSGISDELTTSHILNTSTIPKEFLDKLKLDSGNINGEPTGETTNTTSSAIDIPAGNPDQTPTPAASPSPSPSPTPSPTPTPSSSGTPLPSPNNSEQIPGANTTGSGVTLPGSTTGSDIPPISPEIFAGKTVIIDPGHGFSDPGTSRASVNEKTITLSIGMKLKKMLESAGANVVITRSTDSSTGLYYLYYRSAIANKTILTLEINKTQSEIEEATTMLETYEALTLNKKSEYEALSANASAVEAQNNIAMKIKLQQEYNTLLLNTTTLESEIELKKNYLDELEQKSIGLEYYINDPALKERIGLYEMQGKKASADLTDVFDLTNEKYSKNTIFISIHVNSTEENETSASGAKVYVSDKSTSYYSSYYANYNQVLRDKLGTSLLKNLNLTTNFSKKTTKITKSNLSVLRENNLVSALVEVAFMNNSNDRRLLQQDSTQSKTALGIFNGIKEYFEQN